MTLDPGKYLVINTSFNQCPWNYFYTITYTECIQMPTPFSNSWRTILCCGLLQEVDFFRSRTV